MSLSLTPVSGEAEPAGTCAVERISAVKIAPQTAPSSKMGRKTAMIFVPLRAEAVRKGACSSVNQKSIRGIRNAGTHFARALRSKRKESAAMRAMMCGLVKNPVQKHVMI